MSDELTNLLDQLEELLTQGGRVPFSGRLMVDEAEAIALLDRLRASIPEEVRGARQVLREREQLLEQARRQAQRITEQAQREVSMRLDQEGLLEEADQRSIQILEETRREAESIRRGADGYARDVLTELEARLSQSQRELSEALGRFLVSVRKGLAALEAEEADRLEAPPPE
ncbi:MAG: hypothetical protein JXA37_02900 [Chloroflexia bacterium]|nr:hypothetical protein [Chloroflexia bacterium]